MNAPTSPPLKLVPFQKTGIDNLVHTTHKRFLPSIKKNGLFPSKNPYITKGIYTTPIYAYNPKLFPWKDRAKLILHLKPDAKYFENGVDYAFDALAGEGNPQFKRIYWEVLNELNLVPQEIQKPSPPRTQYEALLAKKLREQGVDIYQSGGEIIILNPKVITKIDLEEEE